MEYIPKLNDEMKYFEDIKTFFKSIENRPIIYWVYKKMFTPYELDKKFMDESIYEDCHGTEGYIKEVILLPDNDILLGIARVFEDSEDNEYNYFVDYYKLSEIRMAYHFRLEDGENDGGTE